MKLIASNCHVLKMNSIRGFSRTLSKFYTIRYGLFEFSEYLFQKTPIDDGFYKFKKHLFFKTLQNGCCVHEAPKLFFIWNIFYLKNYSKNAYLHSHFHDEREFYHYFSSCFYHYFLRCHCHVKLIYIKSSFGFTFK